MSDPFILLDDARTDGASPARLYQAPLEIVIARRADEVAVALARIGALHEAGYHLAGWIAYEAGLALEPRLMPLADARAGAAGPLIWFAAFAGYREIAADDVPAWLAENADGDARIGPLDPALSPGGYARAFAHIQEAIAAGDIYQANLTFPLIGAFHGDPIALYAAIRPAAGAGYGGLIFDGAQWLASFSPELFVALKGGAATVKPMKGTRPRGRDADEDAALAAELAASEKDRAENLMIVDLLRNDLSRVAVPGSVRVERPFSVESYPTVHQMTTTVRADLAERKQVLDLIAALFPCGSITGAPKIRAMELIDAVERDARGAYCGAIGRIDPTGESAFNVAIRTLKLVPDEIGRENGRGTAVLGVGSAVVADSEWLGEWREGLIKGGFVRASAGGFDLIETMAFTPESGIPLLELHLERAKASAGELGFSFDRHAVRNAIQALCFEADAPSKVRLCVSHQGTHSLEVSPMPEFGSDPMLCAVLRLPVDAGDWRLRHKTSDRQFYTDALDLAKAAGAGEALLLRDDGLVTEGSFTNVFVARDGKLLTPPLALGLLPGVLRRSLFEAGKAKEVELTLDDLAGGFFIGNALRGLMAARLMT